MVSILVLMEVTLILFPILCKSLDVLLVSILVLMEVTLILISKCFLISIPKLSFNPCFNGSYSYTFLLGIFSLSSFMCFNPCFNGSYSYTSKVNPLKSQISRTVFNFYNFKFMHKISSKPQFLAY